MKTFFLLFCASLFTIAGFRPLADATLLGIVTDAETKEPLVGAAVKITQDRILIKATVTDIEGRYNMQLKPGKYEVEFTYVGYTTQRVTDVQVVVNQKNTLDIALAMSDNVLSECVVVGYAVAKQKELVSAVSALKAERTADTRKKAAPAKSAASAGKASKPATTAPVAAPDAITITTRPATDDYNPDDIRLSDAPPMPEGSFIKIDPSEPKREFDFDMDKDMSATGRIGEKLKLKTETREESEKTPTPGVPEQPTPRAGLLTAGEWNDLHNWNNHWLDLLADGEIDAYQTLYGFFPKNRFTVLLTNEQDFPVADAVVQLLTGGEIIWEARTDNTGKAELWAGLFNQKDAAELQAVAIVDGQKHDLGKLKTAKDGFNRQQISVACQAPKNVDIVWAVDATGSMGDEIEYLKTELLDVIGRAKSHNPELAFRMGTVFYRDQGDEYLTKSSGLSPDIAQTVAFIGKQFAGGGGDYPEAVHTALEEAIFNQKWSENAIARICFLVLDASPHQSPEVNASLQRSIREAARLGIRIVPVTASGIQKDTEFLMKFFGLATNGSYVFLTDHSGIGGKHIEPTTDEYKVELLNDLLVRLITEYTTIKTCSGQSAIRFEDPQAQPNQPPTTNWQALYYPNPASTQFTLDLPFEVQSVTIYNAEGQAVRKIEKPQAGLNTVMVSDLAPGFYTIRILKDGQMQSGKLMVVKN